MQVIGEMLWIERPDGAAIAHRALPCGRVRLGIFGGRRQRTLPVRLIEQAGTGERLVPVGDVVPAAPLTEAEEAEYRRLDAQLAGTIGEARTLRRFNALRLRSLLFQ